MASSSSTPAAILSSPLGLPISEKLSKNNLQLWKLQVLPAIRGAQLLGYLDGSEVAPDKEITVIDENKKAKPPILSTPNGWRQISRF